MLNLRKFLLGAIGACTFAYSIARDQDTSMNRIFTMDIEELINTKVSIATKSEQPLNETPAIVTVITSDEIQNMGARELEDILQMVPGFELTRAYGGYYGVGIRGVKDSRTTSKLLILVDGVPANQIFYGNGIFWGYDVDIDNIERIEIIRGPGSALYGRNAFSGVVNIINKNAKTGEKIRAKGSYGSYNTKSISAGGSYSMNKLNLSVSARKIYTDVNDVKFDDGYNTSRGTLYRDNYSVNTKLSYGNFAFSGTYLDLYGGGRPADSRATNKIANYALSYSKSLTPKIQLNVQFYGHNSSYMEDIEDKQPGIKKPIPGAGGLLYSDVYPLGIYYKPQFKEYLYGFETELKYKLFTNNDLLLGIQSDLHGVKDVVIPSNIDFATGAPLPGIGRNNQTNWQPGWFINNAHDYNNIAFLVQDIWYPVKKIGITLGARYDIDSEIGAIINPRTGLVLMPWQNTTFKLLYGKAYRAPSPSEQYVTLGFAMGNKNLKPEIINTFEFSISNRYKNINQSLSFFMNKLNDMIYAAKISYIDPRNTYDNIGKNTSTGIEYENKLVLSKSFYSYFNYSFTFSENTDSTTFKHADVAPHKINLGVNYSFLKNFNINMNMFYRSEMERYEIVGSNIKVQDNIGDYAIFNSTFQVNEIYFKGLSLNLSLYNIFNKKYYTQDSQHLNQPSQPGRQIIASLVYKIK